MNNEIKLRALVVDDNEVNIMILIKMLELFDIPSDQAQYGKKAVQMVQSSEYDIIFVDHVMPEMSGIEITEEIHSRLGDSQRPVIIALTSNMTEQVKELFQTAGADEIYSKPIGLLEVTTILRKWFPKVQTDRVSINYEMTEERIKNSYIKSILERMDDIDYGRILHYSVGDPVQYMNILEASVKDLNTSIGMVNTGMEKSSGDVLREGLHKLKSILSIIGAAKMSAELIIFEKSAVEDGMQCVKLKYSYFVKHLEQLKRNLLSVIECYKNYCRNEEGVRKQVYIPMSNEEYEHCLINTIYYIKRYEFDSILREIERLVRQGRADYHQEFELALQDIKQYDYENALNRITKIKNETCKLPVSGN